MIKTRLGIHDGVMENCSDHGLLILELAGERKKMNELARKVSLIKGVSSKLVDLKIIKENCDAYKDEENKMSHFDQREKSVCI